MLRYYIVIYSATFQKMALGPLTLKSPEWLHVSCFAVIGLIAALLCKMRHCPQNLPVETEGTETMLIVSHVKMSKMTILTFIFHNCFMS